MRKASIGLLLLAILFAACKKDPPGNEPEPSPQPSKWTNIKTAPAFGVHFINAQNGFIAESTTISRTLDSGKTWAVVGSGQFGNLFFFDEQHGFAHFPEFGYTTNGGATWQKKSFLAAGAMMWNIFFTTPSTGYQTSDAGLYKTSDTGKTWQKLLFIGTNGAYFFDTNNGWIQSEGKIYKTTDAGANWQHISSVEAGRSLSMCVLQFTDPSHAKFSKNKSFYKSDDGAVTWSQVQFDSTVTDIHFLSNNVGFLTTTSGIYKTVDGGSTWTKELAGNEFLEIFMITENYGFAVGDEGVFKRRQ